MSDPPRPEWRVATPCSVRRFSDARVPSHICVDSFCCLSSVQVEQIVSHTLKELAAAGRGRAPASTSGAAEVGAASGSGGAEAGSVAAAANGAGGKAGGKPAAGLLSQSLSAAAAAGARGGGQPYRPEDAARVARALAERAHLHAKNPTQRTPWSVTSSQQPNFMWAKFFAKGGGKMDDCTVLVAFVSGSE